MHDEPTTSTAQPPPTAGVQDVWPVAITALRAAGAPAGLIALCEERNAVGIARYGTPLQTHNGRKPERDALEEALDLLVYLTQAYLELADDDDGRPPIREAMLSTMTVARALYARHEVLVEMEALLKPKPDSVGV